MKVNNFMQGAGDKNRPGFLQAMLSVLAAAFGVQNSNTRARDFTQGNPVLFIIAGFVFTVLFVLAILLVVSLVLG